MTTKVRSRNLSPIFDKMPAPRAESCANIRPTEVFMARLDDGRWSSHPMALVRCGCQVLPWDPTPTRLRKKCYAANLSRWLPLALSALALFCVPAFGQSDVNDVHVVPRVVEKPPDPPKPDLLASTTGMSAHVRPLKVDVDLVLVPVTITDPMNRLVTGLDKDQFPAFRRQCDARDSDVFQRGRPGVTGRNFRLQRQHGQQDGSRQRRGHRVLQNCESAG